MVATPSARVEDRLVLLVPAHPVALVPAAAEQFDDLSAARRLPVDTTGFDPVAQAGGGVRCSLAGHLLALSIIKAQVGGRSHRVQTLTRLAGIY